MGNSYSFLQAEKKTWIEHTLQFDSQVREANLRFLSDFIDGEPIYLSYTKSSWGGIKFQHWFVTDRVRFLEFGSPDMDIYTARVTINTSPRSRYPTECKDNITRECRMNEDIRSRMRHVLGMCNYSLCLRNCEHVANYVFREGWISSQMEFEQEFIPINPLPLPNKINRTVTYFPHTIVTAVTAVNSVNNLLWEVVQLYRGSLMNVFRHHMVGDQMRMVNSFPASIRPHIFNDESKQIYSFIKSNAIANRFDYYLDYEEDTYNILILGPTGAGKSHLINTFFNRKICESEASHKSVTKEVYFIRGRYSLYNNARELYEERNIIVADTIGLCDTEWNEEKTINLIKGRVNSNFKFLDAVLVVFHADRLQQQVVKNINRILDWLHYNKRSAANFIFIGTHADDLNNNDITRMKKEVKEMLQLHPVILPTGEEVDLLIYTGFPPEETLNDLTKARAINCWDELAKAINNPGMINRLPLKTRHVSVCNIL